MSDDSRRHVRRALVSVYDKTGLEELARGLSLAGIEIVSTGSTAATIAAAGIAVTAVGDVTGFPETLDGRVKTLHPHIHGGLLADLRKESHREQLEDLGILAFELVVVNLYPFTADRRVGRRHRRLRRADRHRRSGHGARLGQELRERRHRHLARRATPTSSMRWPTAASPSSSGPSLAVEAFSHTATYDIAVASWLGSVGRPDPDGNGFPKWLGGAWVRGDVLRYGENPHQRAAVYLSAHHEPALAGAEQLQGKQMSYNNYVDADAARRAAFDHVEPAVAIIKHANPCGIAVGLDVAEAYRRAFATDPVSAFGGVVAANRLRDARDGAGDGRRLHRGHRRPRLRHGRARAARRPRRTCGSCGSTARTWARTSSRARSPAGLLLQVADGIQAEGDSTDAWRLVSGEPADRATLRDLEFAWRSVRSVKSNAILLAKGGAAVGVGMGQVNRVDSARLAVDRAGDRAAGSVAASDAFFPFADGLQVLIDGGVSAVVQPGGSVRDEEVIEAAKAAGVTMYFTGTRHFFH